MGSGLTKVTVATILTSKGCLGQEVIVEAPITAAPITTVYNVTIDKTNIKDNELVCDSTISADNCDITCNGNTACQDITIHCPQTTNCNTCHLTCNGQNSCKRGIVHGYHCSTLLIELKDDPGTGKELTVYASDSGDTYLDHTGNGKDALKNAEIIAPFGAQTIGVTCRQSSENDDECKETIIHAENAANLVLNCEPGTQCEDAIVYCPDRTQAGKSIEKGTTTCNIKCDTTAICSIAAILSDNGWEDDISFDCLGSNAQGCEVNAYCGNDIPVDATDFDDIVSYDGLCSLQDGGSAAGCVGEDSGTDNNPTAQCNPTNAPSYQPSNVPSEYPSDEPSNRPSDMPSNRPSDVPSDNPSNKPSLVPSNVPSSNPTRLPSDSPTRVPSDIASDSTTNMPTTTTLTGDPATLEPVETVGNTDDNDSGDSGDTGDTGGDNGDNGDSGDSGNTGDIGVSTTDSGDTGDTGDTGDAGDSGGVGSGGSGDSETEGDGGDDGDGEIVGSGTTVDSGDDGGDGGNDSLLTSGALKDLDDTTALIVVIAVGAVAVLLICLCIACFVRYKTRSDQKKAMALQRALSRKSLKSFDGTNSPNPKMSSIHSISAMSPSGGSSLTPGFMEGAKDNNGTANDTANGTNGTNGTYRETHDEEEKAEEYVTPGGPARTSNDGVDSGGDVSDSSEAEMQAIRTEVVVNAYASGVTPGGPEGGANNKNNNNNSRVSTQKRESLEMGVEIAKLMEEADRMRAESKHKQDRQDTQFGMMLSDKLIAADLIEDDIVNQMNNDISGGRGGGSGGNGVTPNGVGSGRGNSYITPSGNDLEMGNDAGNDIANVAGEGGQAYEEVNSYVTPM